MSLFVFSLIGVAVFTFQKDVFSTGRLLSDNLTAQSEARRALKMMSAEIRSASQGSSGAYTVASAATSTFMFYSDIDSEPLKERVRYFLEGTTLKKGTLKPTGNPLQYVPGNEVVSDVVRDIANGTTSIFAYYDSTYAGTSSPLADPANPVAVRLVQITFAIDKSPLVPPPPMTMTTQVSLRNVKDNL